MKKILLTLSLVSAGLLTGCGEMPTIRGVTNPYEQALAPEKKHYPISHQWYQSQSHLAIQKTILENPSRITVEGCEQHRELAEGLKAQLLAAGFIDRQVTLSIAKGKCKKSAIEFLTVKGIDCSMASGEVGIWELDPQFGCMTANALKVHLEDPSDLLDKPSHERFNTQRALRQFRVYEQNSQANDQGRASEEAFIDTLGRGFGNFLGGGRG